MQDCEHRAETLATCSSFWLLLFRYGTLKLILIIPLPHFTDVTHYFVVCLLAGETCFLKESVNRYADKMSVF